jgi:hypothetical protein
VPAHQLAHGLVRSGFLQFVVVRRGLQYVPKEFKGALGLVLGDLIDQRV